MSRYTAGSTIAYGYDHACGYFFQVFGPEDIEGYENLIVDECSLFTKMSNARMVELLRMYGLSEEHVSRVLSDLPF